MIQPLCCISTILKRFFFSPKVPLYQTVCQDLKNLIRTGAYEVGDFLPAEGELEEQHDVSRTTVRKVINIVDSLSILENILIYETPGKGGILRWKDGGAKVQETFFPKVEVPIGDTILEVEHLTYGNQQKVGIGKWLLEDFNIYLLDEVAAGEGSKEEILKYIMGGGHSDQT